LKFPGRWKFDELKQRLVLTAEEKRVIVFIFVAFVLGLAAKHYRAAHPQPLPDFDKKRPHSPAYGVSSSPSQSVAPIRKRIRKPRGTTPPPNSSSAETAP
jgi:hypothetical protein